MLQPRGSGISRTRRFRFAFSPLSRLDQTGFSQVELGLVARIFRELQAAEVILTFAVDALTNHLAKTPSLVKAVAPLDLTEARLHELTDLKISRMRSAGERSFRERYVITFAP